MLCLGEDAPRSVTGLALSSQVWLGLPDGRKWDEEWRGG